VVGVSVDDVESHKEFADKYKLPFILLADVDGEMAESYGVLRDWKLVQIAARQSFIVGPDGTVVKHYEDVDPDTHTQEVLADLETLMAGG
jgi:peroxiredoxin Q/BCP